MNRFKELWALLLVATAILLLYSLLPLGTALEFGRDEGFEVIKPFLCLNGFALYKDIWSDQPPILTVILTWAFRTWGPTILVARLVAASYGLVLFLAFFQLARQRSGIWVALLATFLLVAAPVVFQLAVSVMLEVPAFAAALVSALLAFRMYSRWRWGWLVGSGMIMGIALQTKLTAALVAPAIVVEIGLAASSQKLQPPQPHSSLLKGRRRQEQRVEGPVRSPSRKQPWMHAAFLDIAMWGIGVATAFLVIGFIWARGSLLSSFQSHFHEHFVPGHGQPEDYAFSAALLGKHLEGLAGTVIGLAVCVWQKRWREISFPATLLATATAIHAVHRPWWSYYYLHLAIPMAWLSGLGIKEIIAAASAPFVATRPNFASGKTWKGIGLCGIAAVLLAYPEKRLEGTIKDLRQQATLASSKIVAKMKHYAPRTHWAYADPVIYPFHAEVLVPPDVAIVMLKRFWSGQITVEAIVNSCLSHGVEQLVLPGTPSPEWIGLLASNYKLVCSENGWSLFVAKDIYETQPAKQK